MEDQNGQNSVNVKQKSNKLITCGIIQYMNKILRNGISAIFSSLGDLIPYTILENKNAEITLPQNAFLIMY